MVNNQINNLISVENIFEYFKNLGYVVETDESSFPLSELIEKPIEGDVWTVIDTTNLTVLIIQSPNYNRKSYRNKINSNLKELVGTKIIFFTDDFNDYNLTLIFDGIFNIKFNPSNPDIDVVRIFEAFENQEDIFDYTKQDINFILLKRQLTAKILKDSIREGDNSSVKLTFQEGGIRLIGESLNKVIVSYNDAPIRDMAIDVKLEYNSDLILDEEIEFISDLYKKTVDRDLKLVCIITAKGLLYHWLPYLISGFISFSNQQNKDVLDEVLESLIAQVSSRTAFNSETFHQQFGTYSPFYILGITAFQQFFDEEQEKLKIMYEEWKSRFSKVYQTGDLDRELFIKHAYLSLLIKTVLISKFVGPNRNTSEDNLQKIIDIFEERGVPIFLNDFFQWTSEEIFVQKEIFETLHRAEFVIDDLFRTIYQEMVSPSTRHALGEFYTPAPLAQKMVEEAYIFGQYVLDPACGSGTFLIEILNIIHNSSKKIEEKIEAISKIYGFDVNPIAVLVARSNLLLLTDKIFNNREIIPINIFLADSLNPINEFIRDIDKTKLYKKKLKTDRFKEVKDITSLEKWGVSEYGEVERFNMPAINDSLAINVKFFRYIEQFGDLLRILDKNLSKDIELVDMLRRIYKSSKDDWLEESCEGLSEKKLRDNFEYIAKKLYKYVKEDKNHIWAYLLYNAIGVRKMKETMEGVDLIIGNPPWLTIADILSYDYKEYVKSISKNLGIYVGGKQAPNTELCSIFFYKTSDLYLKQNGNIFFVVTAALGTGDQHSKFRMFKGFKDLAIWKFSSDVFNIPNICLNGIKSKTQPINERLKIKTRHYNVLETKKNWEFNLIKESVYVPYNLKTINKDNEAKRLIPILKLDEMLSHEDSHYKKKFKRGADLFPRNFFFITILKDGLIVPDKSLIQKKPWNFYPVEIYDIEEDYVFKVYKSTELVPFHLLFERKCFLPIERNDYIYKENLIKPKAKKLFNKFSNKYEEIQKRDQRKITKLWGNLNHMNKLSNPMQFSKIKVVYPASGSFLKAAVVRDNAIVDTKLYFIDLDNLGEAYYLCAILNSKIISNDIKYRSATGFQGKGAHIHKRALEYPIPLFDEDDELHLNISEIGKEMEKIVKDLIDNMKEREYKYLKKRIMCRFCSKTYNRNNLERILKNHEKSCKKVETNHKWIKRDWINLENITKNEVKLSFLKAQNTILDNNLINEKFDELDVLVLELLNSRS